LAAVLGAELSEAARKADPASTKVLLAVLAVIFWLWETPWVFPIKILAIFFHELSHGLAALFTGGRIRKIEIFLSEGGLCHITGGNRFLTLSAGYLGSLLWGGAILIAASRTRYDREIAVALGGLIAYCTAFWLRPIFSFGFLFGLASAAGLVACGRFQPEHVNDLVLRTIGLTSCLYAVFDIKSDILDRPHLTSDAVMLAEVTGVPAVVWGILWITLAVAGTLHFFKFSCMTPGESVTQHVSSARLMDFFSRAGKATGKK